MYENGGGRNSAFNRVRRYAGISSNAAPGENAAFSKFLHTTITMKNTNHNESIDKALTDLRLQKHPNIRAIIRTY